IAKEFVHRSMEGVRARANSNVNRRGGTIGSGSKLGNGPEFLHCVQAGLDAGGRQILTIYIDAIHTEDGVSGAASGQGRAFNGGKSRRGTRTCFRAGGES